MIAIVDYGVGNLFSLQSSFEKIGAKVVVSSDEKQINNAEKIILPGVGAFEDAIKKLTQTGMAEVLKEQVKKGKFVMGICLGMQLLFEKSYEYGCHDGLGLLKGKVVPLKDDINPLLKVPHIGWNGLQFTRPHFLLEHIKEGDCTYFVHSYHAVDCLDSLVATTEYDKQITAMVAKENILGCQFHPEKSGDVGLNILRAFVEKKD